MSPDYGAFALLVRSVLALRPAYASRSPRAAALVEDAQLRQLQAIEDQLAAALVRCGVPLEPARHSALEFVAQCARQYASKPATSC